MSHIQEGEKIFHSCLNKNRDGSNRLFENVAYLQIDLFGNDPGVTSGVRTRAQENEQKKANVEEFNRYFQTLWNIQRWLEASDSEGEILKETD